MKRKANASPIIIDDAEIGPVHYARSRRAKRIALRIRADGEVRVTLPEKGPLEEAVKFVGLKRAWIRQHLDAARIRGEVAQRLTETAAGIDPEAAARMIVARLDELARRFGFTYNRVTIRNQKTRWGSCSVNNNLSLNLKLALLEPELRDLVLVHELLHTRIKNHGPKFKAELERLIPGAARLDRRLNEFSGLLRVPLKTAAPAGPAAEGATRKREKF